MRTSVKMPDQNRRMHLLHPIAPIDLSVLHDFGFAKFSCGEVSNGRNRVQ